jgi:hypothetical protein
VLHDSSLRVICEWHKIWDMRLPPKLKYFCWILLHVVVFPIDLIIIAAMFNVKLFALSTMAQLKMNWISLQIVATLSRVGRRKIFDKVSSTNFIKATTSPIFSSLFQVWKRPNNISLLFYVVVNMCASIHCLKL